MYEDFAFTSPCLEESALFFAPPLAVEGLGESSFADQHPDQFFASSTMLTAILSNATFEEQLGAALKTLPDPVRAASDGFEHAAPRAIPNVLSGDVQAADFLDYLGQTPGPAQLTLDLPPATGMNMTTGPELAPPTALSMAYPSTLPWPLSASSLQPYPELLQEQSTSPFLIDNALEVRQGHQTQLQQHPHHMPQESRASLARAHNRPVPYRGRKSSLPSLSLAPLTLSPAQGAQGFHNGSREPEMKTPGWSLADLGEDQPPHTAAAYSPPYPMYGQHSAFLPSASLLSASPLGAEGGGHLSSYELRDAYDALQHEGYHAASLHSMNTWSGYQHQQQHMQQFDGEFYLPGFGNGEEGGEEEVRFACSQCPKRFRRRNDLRRHALSHQAIRNAYVCTMCNKQFTRADTRLRHLRSGRCLRSAGESLTSSSSPSVSSSPLGSTTALEEGLHDSLGSP